MTSCTRVLLSLLFVCWNSSLGVAAANKDNRIADHHLLAQADINDMNDLERALRRDIRLSDEQLKGIWALGATLLMAILIGMLFAFAIAILILYLFYTCAASIPIEHQQVSPGMVFLMLIPCANIIICFFVFPKIAEGFQSYFHAQGRTDVGDAGGQLALWYCICIACSVVPYAGALPGLAAFVLMIILLVKFMEYKQDIQRTASSY